jgi:hypothetical protein
LKEFKASFSTMVCELELKYGVNYTKVFVFKQLTHYVHFEALDVYEEQSPRILGITQIPNATASLCHSHRHHLSSYTTNYYCTSWDCAQ